MQLNNTTQYAIRILSYIAKNGNSRLYSAKELSAQLNIPYKFLTKIMTELVNSAYINSLKGRGGGYELSIEPNNISILDILKTFKDLEEEDKCFLGIGKCDVNNKCALHDQWHRPKVLLYKMYEETTLDKLEEMDFKI